MQTVTNKKCSTESASKAVFLKRARSKYVTNLIALKLLSAGDLRQDEKKRFKRMLFCSGSLIKQNEKYISHFCSNRFCLVCNRIRTANLINGYSKPIESLKDKSFLTLTVKNCTASHLKKTIGVMKKEFFNLRKALKKRYKIKIEGLRKIEVTFNPITETYHPHLHLLVSDTYLNYCERSFKLTEIMIFDWIKRFPETTNIKAQDTTPARDGDIKEMFKYFTKIISKDKKTGKFKMTKSKNLRVIMDSVTGTRIFQTYGSFRKVKIEKIPKPEQINLFDSQELFQWTQFHNDWLSHNTGVLLTGYKPTDTLKQTMIENGFNTYIKPPELKKNEADPIAPERNYIVQKANEKFHKNKILDWDSVYEDRLGFIHCLSDWQICIDLFNSKNSN